MMLMSAGPRAAVITAASRNWPSPPRFQMPARKATMSPAAISSSGAMRVSVSCSPRQREQAALQHIAVIGQGSLPSASRITPPTTSARRTGPSAPRDRRRMPRARRRRLVARGRRPARSVSALMPPAPVISRPTLARGVARHCRRCRRAGRWNITPIRSQMLQQLVEIGGDQRAMAMPRSALAMMRWRDARVLQIEAVGRLVEDHHAGAASASSRASSTFWMLPPESRPIGVRSDGVRMSWRRISSRAWSSISSASLTPLRQNGAAPISLEHQIGRHREGADRALAQPLVGDIAEARRRRRRRRSAARWPRRRAAIRPPAAARWPASTSASCFWPLPSMPAMPSTSPGQSSKLTLGERAFAAIGRRRRPAQQPATSAIDRSAHRRRPCGPDARPRRGIGLCLPNISRTIVVGDPCSLSARSRSGGISPTSRPSRSTEMRSPSAYASRACG